MFHFFCFEWRYIYVALAESDGKMCSVAWWKSSCYGHVIERVCMLSMRKVGTSKVKKN
jgi:hypothetical protein